MKVEKDQRATVAFFLVPGLIIYVYFFALPVFQSVWESMFYWKGLRGAGNREFVGLQNYVFLFTQDLYFWKAFSNTVFLMVVNLLLQIPLAFVMAMIVNSGIRGSKIFNFAFFMPYVFSATSVALMWRFLYHPNGFVNQFLTLVGLESVTTAWLANPATNMGAIAIVGVWQGAGISMILLGAGLAGIPAEVLESCKLEGATQLQTVTRVIIPMMWPVFTTVSILVLIGSVKSFDIIWVLTRGGPFHSTEVLTTWMYQQGLVLNEPARGATLASFIFIFTLLLNLIVRIVTRRENVEY